MAPSELPRQSNGLLSWMHRAHDAEAELVRLRPVVGNLEVENRKLRELITEARDLVAQAYGDDEDNDSPGNMAFAVLNDALEEPVR